ncbi:hypothetical protein DPMN_090464 [Dreissena polymorpha]|uniref:Uncharacterized protein n=1 Tax=Dreissena polymorpha TaxID=45954 RepID=A0A9D4QZT4_DREPO|nr:hypothetical protein DPMN_090464 [Dreissena polymorpha]
MRRLPYSELFSGRDRILKYICQDDTRVKKGSPIPSTGAPFVIVGFRLLECHQGPDHRKQAN